jgi:hypothetical protein
LGLSLAAVSPQPRHAAAAILTVSNLNDNGSGSLRDAVAASASGDTIVFANGSTGTIALTNGEIATGPFHQRFLPKYLQ